MAKGKGKVHTQEDLSKQLKEQLEAVPEIKEEKAESTLSDLDLSEFSIEDGTQSTKYTTELLDNLEKIDGTISSEQLNNLISYSLKGGTRPDFADAILTQSSAKMEEILKVVAQLQMLCIPELLDRQMTIRKTILTPEVLKGMTYADMAEMEANIGKEIKDILDISLKIITQLNKENRIPTSAEKLANAIMGLSASGRARIEEVIADYSDTPIE